MISPLVQYNADPDRWQASVGRFKEVYGYLMRSDVATSSCQVPSRMEDRKRDQLLLTNGGASFRWLTKPLMSGAPNKTALSGAAKRRKPPALPMVSHLSGKVGLHCSRGRCRLPRPWGAPHNSAVPAATAVRALPRACSADRNAVGRCCSRVQCRPPRSGSALQLHTVPTATAVGGAAAERSAGRHGRRGRYRGRAVPTATVGGGAAAGYSADRHGRGGHYRGRAVPTATAVGGTTAGVQCRPPRWEAVPQPRAVPTATVGGGTAAARSTDHHGGRRYRSQVAWAGRLCPIISRVCPVIAGRPPGGTARACYLQAPCQSP